MRSLPELMAHWRSDPAIGRRVVVFGSSNTELWWHNLGRFSWSCWLNVSLRAHVGKQVSLTNVGICGETVIDLAKRYDRDITPHRPDVVIVTIGGNDRNHMSIAEYRARLIELGRRIARDGILPVFNTYYSMLLEDQNGSPDDFAPYMSAMVGAADELQIPCIDSFPMFRAYHRSFPREYRGLMLDPNHLNPLGHAIWGTLVVRAFGMPDPQTPSDIAEATNHTLAQMDSLGS